MSYAGMTLEILDLVVFDKKNYLLKKCKWIKAEICQILPK